MPPSSPRTIIMPETTTAPTPKAKPKPVSASIFEVPKFEMPKFEMPNVEVPAAFREFAEKGVAQAKDNYDKMKTAAEHATEVMESTYNTATSGASSYNLKLIETARINTNATFDLFSQLLTAKSYSEVVEKTTAFMRSQFDTVTAQAKELTEHAQKVATETAEPIKESITTTFNKAA
jgi:phasin